jgi:quinoprotein glucose dehydrogenase
VFDARLVTGCIVAVALAGCSDESVHTSKHASFPAAVEDWDAYGGPQSNRFSPLTQLTPENVAGLTEVWRFDTGVGGLQTSPLVVGTTMYGFTATQDVFALNAGTGSVVWTFDPGREGRQPARGLSYWREGSDHRLFAGVMHELWALDPRTGKPINGFGEDGKIDLRKDLNDRHEANVTYLTSPGVELPRQSRRHPAPCVPTMCARAT